LTGLLAAGAITMGVTAASANTAGFCSASSTSTVKATCTVTEKIVMKANGGKYCLDDPASSKHNGTQLIVWTCKNGTNQHWFTSLG
jgi:hypothetical protein